MLNTDYYIYKTYYGLNSSIYSVNGTFIYYYPEPCYPTIVLDSWNNVTENTTAYPLCNTTTTKTYKYTQVYQTEKQIIYSKASFHDFSIAFVCALSLLGFYFSNFNS